MNKEKENTNNVPEQQQLQLQQQQQQQEPQTGEKEKNPDEEVGQGEDNSVLEDLPPEFGGDFHELMNIDHSIDIVSYK